MKTRNKILIITSIIFVIGALIILICGFALSGVDIIGWFATKWAYWLYTFAAVYVLVVVFVLVLDKIKKL